MGYALAEAAVNRGWEVDLVSGPVALTAAVGVNVQRVISAAEMLSACERLFARCEIFIAVAAVADFRPKAMEVHKTRKAEAALVLELEPTVDILKTLAARKKPAQCIVGFAAETRDVELYARRKLTEKNLDWIVANDVSQAGVGMEAADNAVIMIGRKGERVTFGPAPKRLVADFILDQVGLR